MRLNELLEYGNIVIQCHDFPDADTLASGFGVYMYLREHDKNPSLVYSGKQKITKPNLLHMIERLEIPIRYVTDIGTPEALVTVDCCYGEGNVTRFPAENVFVIDHHCFNEVCRYRNEIRSSYSSCATIISQLLREERYDYNQSTNLATALYYGLYSDSNGMNEISHPADRDLRDLAVFDAVTVNLLRNSNLSLEEMKIAGDALKHYKYNKDFGFAIVEAMPCDPNILGFISDLLLQVDEVKTCVVFCCKAFGIKLSVRSCTNNIRASELVQYIVLGHGTGGGHSQKAGGYLQSFSEGVSAAQYIYDRMIRYHSSYEIIYADEYTADLCAMKKYVKKPLTLGYVRTSDIFAVGTEMCIRTLEADLNVKADDDIYIMVGIRGEVYPIRKEKFAASYIPYDEKFAPKTDYDPTVIKKDSFSVVRLAPYIKKCVSGIAEDKTAIYAYELEHTVKVFTAWDKNSYMLGNKSDFLAVRCDDLHDVYIIERSIFSDTYQLC